MGGFDEFSKKPTQQKTTIPSKLVTLILVISTNILTLLLFSDRSIDLKWFPSTPKTNLWASNALLQKLNSTEAQLTAAQAQASDLHRRLLTSNSLLETLLTELGRAHGEKSEPGDLDRWLGEIDGELKLAIGPHKLPLGFTSNIGSNKIYAPLGSGCLKYQDELAQYMNYKAGAQCPSDDVFAQRLMLKGCEPLPPPRCNPKSPKNYGGPRSVPESFWRVPPDTSISWDRTRVKLHVLGKAAVTRRVAYDCKDCFDLGAAEKPVGWCRRNSVSYGIDGRSGGWRPPGTIRIGLDNRRRVRDLRGAK
ncbi:uncharacterized protein A4U43_C09F4240 [Asparagus officinalis]|uniref:Methyltransferase n=1 Tax=Asparagus officinalis TaxID=4686 RepID=A0A5P1E584_ASPOF|nr:uncharacterized protein A4U43_C09F4240 [Asparagus officinalis]